MSRRRDLLLLAPGDASGQPGEAGHPRQWAYVKLDAYASVNFQRVLQEKFELLKSKGIDPNFW